MKEGNLYAGIAAFLIAAGAISAADNPGPPIKQVEVLLNNRVAVLPPKESPLAKTVQIRLK